MPDTSSAPLVVPGPKHVFEHKGNTDALYETEWLLTIGNGGFAMGTALGVNRRKYHALLVGSAHPPVERLALLNSLDVEVTIDPDSASATTAWLAAHRWSKGGLERENVTHLKRFEKEPDTCRWVFAVGPVEIVKELRVGWRRNDCAVRYSVRTGGRKVRLRVLPIVTIRDFHGTLPKLDQSRFNVTTSDRFFSVTAEDRMLEVACDVGRAIREPSVRQGVLYDRETERHQEDTEDLFSPGWFEINCDATRSEHMFTIAAALAPDTPDFALFDRREKMTHLDRTVNKACEGHSSAQALTPLIHAADDFLVQRDVEGRPLTTVIAGYPWFADWGRDTMISMVGLMVAARRFDDALGCLRTFASHVSQGMIPNRFDDYGEPPHYNTIDAPMWFLHAATEYLSASNDRRSFDEHLLPACLSIIEHYEKGTRYGIRADPADGLIVGGDDTTQLTWMDAKRNGVVFTPRHGKAVEISALWHHGLVSIAEALAKSDPRTSQALREKAARVAASFRKVFVGGPDGGLHDCMRPDAKGVLTPSGELRPNQIFAVSLAHSPLTHDEQQAVVACVRKHLLTPMGLRTLAPISKGYCPRFDGDMMSRDRAYHNGTVWPWLIGPFAEAVLRVGGFSSDAKIQARKLIEPLAHVMAGYASGVSGAGCVGQIAEVYDADEPRRPQGCIAQAWSVAEVLRVAMLAM